MECNQWNEMEWNGDGQNGVGRNVISGMEWDGQNEMEWDGMECNQWNGMECGWTEWNGMKFDGTLFGTNLALRYFPKLKTVIIGCIILKIYDITDMVAATKKKFI